MKSLKALIVEDSQDDIHLLVYALKNAGYQLSFIQIQSAEELSRALSEPGWEIVISDYSLPGFSGMEALNMVKSLHPEIPFIMVSGTIGEDTAVDVMKSGAQDYLMKGNLKRLIPAVERELNEAARRRRMQVELQGKEEQLRQSQKIEAIGNLVGGIAHDFNNFLGVLMLTTERVLAELPEEHKTIGDMQTIKMATERAAALTRQLLIFSRKQMAEPQVLELNPIINHMFNLFRQILGEGIEFIVELNQDIGSIFIDRSQLEQVLMNLVVNARDAMPDGGRLVVRTEKENAKDGLTGPHVKLTVEDSGCGMDEDTQKKIFEPFFTTKGPNKGTGLGLSTVLNIVKQFKGQVSVSSILGKGTQFFIYFPVTSQAREASPIAPQKMEDDGGTEVLLLVEDGDAFREILTEVLKRKGYDVFAFKTAKQATDFAVARENRKMDLLISDLILPDRNGVDLAKDLVAMRPGLKVLLMSGYLDKELPANISISFLQKPFPSQLLLEKIKVILEMKE